MDVCFITSLPDLIRTVVIEHLFRSSLITTSFKFLLTPPSATQQEAPPLQHPPPPPVMTLSWPRSLCSSCLPPASWRVGGCQLPLSDFLRLRDYLTIILEYSRDSFQGRTDAPDICYRLVHPEKIQKLYWSTGFDVFLLFILKKYNET